jgi:hypothetical protein
MSTITINGHTHKVPATFDLAAVIAAVEHGAQHRFVLTLPPSPRPRVRQVIFTTSQVDAIEAHGLKLAVVDA